MEVRAAKETGFCMGIERAIEMTMAQLNTDKTIYMLGDIAHNETVTKNLCELGLKIVYDIEDVEDENILIIRAHGTTPLTFERSRQKNLVTVDTTCPLIRKIQSLAQGLESEGYQLVLIGDSNHDEVISIKSHCENMLVISNSDEVLNYKDLLREKTAILVQTTSIIDEVRDIVADIILISHEVRFINTICEPTKKRQKEAIELAKQCDTVFIVGSKSSKNTKNLHKLSKKYNKESYFISNDTEIDELNLANSQTIGVIPGASTPIKVTNEVIEFIRNYSLTR